eukprot:CAMPEP_0196651482 /NCGR_PEP_ID=MMETSP1086-20130531/440_1 /TAXON_ID=77921 /ORGANISM="Cyanoptyche  gloeocystis , Strain SAG4.97" /LENGTH=117 /DNA_ID=CAMNT_0041981501 /DNA_START=858 /DNA_END=1212 /DNA_ORIENTATION=-
MHNPWRNWTEWWGLDCFRGELRDFSRRALCVRSDHEAEETEAAEARVVRGVSGSRSWEGIGADVGYGPGEALLARRASCAADNGAPLMMLREVSIEPDAVAPPYEPLEMNDGMNLPA